MAKIEIPSKIRAENFSEENRAVASGIGAVYNQFVDQLYFLINGGIDSQNLNRQYVDVNVTINASGQVVNPPAIRLTMRSKPVMIHCGRAVCLSNNQTFPTGTPFVSFAINNNTLIITNITNLQANTQYNLTLELVG